MKFLHSKIRTPPGNNIICRKKIILRNGNLIYNINDRINKSMSWNVITFVDKFLLLFFLSIIFRSMTSLNKMKRMNRIVEIIEQNRQQLVKVQKLCA